MSVTSAPLSKRLLAEAIGTAFLLAVIVGSGIMGERLANGNAAVALLANSYATGCGLAVLIYIFAPISGAHFNPLVTLALAARGQFAWREVAPYAAVQVLAAIAGVALANFMFGEPLFSAATHVRTGWAQWASEALATFGLFSVIFLASARGADKTGGLALAVGGYIAAAYWFTSSTSFANPAVTLARSLSDTFAGIRPVDVLLFVVAQCVGATLALAGIRIQDSGFSKRLDLK